MAEPTDVTKKPISMTVDVQIANTESSMRVLHSGWLQAVYHSKVQISAKGLNLVLTYKPGDQEIETNIVAGDDNFTLLINYEGKLPNSPFSVGTASPLAVGKVGGKELLVTLRLSRPIATLDTFELLYSLYERSLNGK